jgi:Ca-activated chloride channel family protein
MSFLSPERLWLLLGIAALAGVYVMLQLRRSTYAVRFTNIDLLASVAPRSPGWRRHATAAVFLGAVAMLVVAFAQPARDEKVPRERATVIMAIDTSLSMEATDVTPSRFAAAKDAAKTFVDLLPATLNLGLVSFDGTAVVQVAPTIDRQIVKDSIDNLTLDQSTAIGDAILASLTAIETVPPDAEGTAPPARIVLMSDGDTTIGTPNEVAAAQAVEAGVPISAIAFGTASGVIDVPEEPGPIPVPVNEQALRTIADQTDGTFFSAATAEELQSVYLDIGSSVGFEIELAEITIWFIGFALILFMATAALSLLWFSRLP